MSEVVRMRTEYKLLGKYIRLIDERNRDLSVSNLRGVSIGKKFIPSIANIVGTDLSNYKIVRTGQFAYGPVTSRNGEKISIAYLDGDDCIISSSYTVFEVENKKELDPEYLMLWFSRPKFDRYARYKSHGSVREIFDWNELCMVELPIPEIDEQRNIVKAYNTIMDRIVLKQKINDNLVSTLSAVYKKHFADVDAHFPKVPLQKICSKIGSGATPKGGKTAYISDGISLIRSTNVFDFNFEYNELAHINQNQADALSNVIVKPNDVLFNITGVSVARCCMVPNDVLPARVNQHVMIIRPFKGETMSYYIMFTLCSADSKAKLLGISQSGSTREAINKQELESFEIPLPNDETLNQFAITAKQIYKNIYSNVKEIRTLEKLKIALLTQLSSR